MITLYHLAISHYNEKVRWALDLKQVPHRRKALIPGLHRLRVRRIAGGRTTPAIIDNDSGARIGESSEILQYLDAKFPEPPLYPADETDRKQVHELEEYLDRKAGPAVRGFSYWYLVHHPRVLRRRWEPGLTGPQRFGLRLLLPGLLRMLPRAFDLTAENTARRADLIRRICDRLEARLEETGDGYLIGGQFTAADLTAACLLGPPARPQGSPWEGMGSIDPELDPEYPPPEMQAFLEGFEARPIYRWIQYIWKRHRVPTPR